MVECLSIAMKEIVEEISQDLHLIIMLTGMLLGYLLRSKRLSWIHKIITLLIWILLFLLGIDVGGNESIIKGLHTLGLEAVVITVAAVIGSTLCAWGLWYLLYSKGKETKA